MSFVQSAGITIHRMRIWNGAWVIFFFCAAIAIPSSAQTFKTLASFDYTDGEAPQYVSLVQGVDGNFYGTSYLAGENFGGTVFKVTPGGAVTSIYNFPAALGDGFDPTAGLVLGKDGNFYGVTTGGGANSKGTVFKVTPAGKETILYSFNGDDGEYPTAPLIQASNGNFYGTTPYGGANSTECSGMGCGTIFEITPSGTLTTLYSFCSEANCADGSEPLSPVMQASNGAFYGTANMGGANGYGTIFKTTSTGAFSTVYSFALSGSNGVYPQAGLMQATNGNFYGTTLAGGADGAGTVFEMTAAGQVTFFGSFDFSDGLSPMAPVVQGSDGNFYGTTAYGGANFVGNLYQITPTGTITNLYSFCSLASCADGEYALGGLLQSTNGSFYGVTEYGGASNDLCALGCGTIYSLSMGLRPFVKTLPAAGKVGSQVEIMGNKLTGATAVTFNGTSATFTVRSASLIVATVPTGATSGTVKVTLPAGTLSSNVPFRVLP